MQEIGREPTPEEIAERMDFSLDKVRKVLKIAEEPISLDTPIGEEEVSWKKGLPRLRRAQSRPFRLSMYLLMIILTPA